MKKKDFICSLCLRYLQVGSWFDGCWVCLWCAPKANREKSLKKIAIFHHKFIDDDVDVKNNTKNKTKRTIKIEEINCNNKL